MLGPFVGQVCPIAPSTMHPVSDDTVTFVLSTCQEDEVLFDETKDDVVEIPEPEPIVVVMMEVLAVLFGLELVVVRVLV